MSWRNLFWQFALGALMVFACLFLGSPNASAKNGRKPRSSAAKAECKESAERAQQLRMDGKLLAAREELHACLRPTCSAVVRNYCTRWFEEVEASLPTLVIKVRDQNENDLSDVTVSVDGVRNDDWREGLAIPLDPGEHELAFERVGSEPQTTRVMLGASEKNRIVVITMRAIGLTEMGDEAQEQTPRESQVDSSAQDPGRTRMRRAAWATLGVAALSVGAFAAFGALGKRDLDALRDSCDGNCPKDEVDAAWTKLIIADVSLGLAAVGVGVSTWLFIASRGKNPDREPPAQALSIAPHEHGLFGSFRTRF